MQFSGPPCTPVTACWWPVFATRGDSAVRAAVKTDEQDDCRCSDAACYWHCHVTTDVCRPPICSIWNTERHRQTDRDRHEQAWKLPQVANKCIRLWTVGLKRTLAASGQYPRVAAAAGQVDGPTDQTDALCFPPSMAISPQIPNNHIYIIIIYYATRAAHTHTTAYNHIHQHTQNYIQNYILRSIKTQKKTKNELHAYSQ